MSTDIMTSLSLMVGAQQASGFDAPWSLTFRHDGPPKSKSRARFSKRGYAYTPEETRRAEVALTASWSRALSGETHAGPLALSCVFFRPNYQRIDCDNMTKLVMDAGTKAKAWRDDSQVMIIVSRIEYDATNPRTEVTLTPAMTSFNRPEQGGPRACERCKTVFTPSSPRSRGVFCSGACAQTITRAEANCANCGKLFQRKKAGQRTCDVSCRSKLSFSETVSAGKRNPPPQCGTCGGRVSRREYRQCSGCSTKGRPLGSKNKERTLKRLTADERASVRAARLAGYSLESLAVRFGASISSIRQVCRVKGVP